MSVAIEERCRKLFVEFLGVSGSDVKDETTLEQLGGDSLDKVELIMAHEEEFGIAITHDDAERLDTFGDWARFVTANYREG